MRGPVLLQWLTLLSLLLYFWASVGKSAQDQMWKNGRHEPWSSGYGRHLLFERLRVQIPAQYTGWTGHFSHWFAVKIVLNVWKDRKWRKKRPELAHFLKKPEKVEPGILSSGFQGSKKVKSSIGTERPKKVESRIRSGLQGPEEVESRVLSGFQGPEKMHSRILGVPERSQEVGSAWSRLEGSEEMWPVFLLDVGGVKIDVDVNVVVVLKVVVSDWRKNNQKFLFNCNLLSNGAFSR